MTDYTPTDGALRAAWFTARGHSGSLVSGRLLQSEFDRWVAAHDARVAADALRAEREAIRGYTLNFGSAGELYDQLMFLLERDANIIAGTYFSVPESVDVGTEKLDGVPTPE